ncbi:cytochrome P450 [Mycena crocata]|nr:cytochrome P450 [Mycena crocata]
MPALTTPTIIVHLTLVLTILLLYAARTLLPRRSSLPLPPGPRKLPFFGNFFDMPKTFAWEACMEWSRLYNSDIIHLNLAGRSVIVLSSVEATEALLERRSSIYSDRYVRPSTMIKELMGWNFSFGVMEYGSRAHRRLFNQQFNQGAVRNFRVKQRAAAHSMLRNLLHNPGGWVGHLRQMSGEVIISAAYGLDVLPANDPYIELAEKAARSLIAASSPGLYLVESFPILKYIPEWVPGARFQRVAREGRELAHATRDVPFDEVKRQIASGHASPSLTTDALRALESTTTNQFYEERTVKGTAATMYGLGADTTVSSLSTFVLAMLANPQAQRMAQAEIDRVVGRVTLPEFGDEDALPYVGALIKEVLRWRNVTPFGVAHYIPVEDEYRGYRIPAGSTVFGNVWAILHDETIYPDPYAFKPERFLLDGKPNPDVRSPQAAFGFGRRICPGRHLATASMWIAVTSILAAFDITKAVDENGQVIEPSYEYVSGLVVNPRPFKCVIKPRGPETVAMVEAAVNAAV